MPKYNTNNEPVVEVQQQQQNLVLEYNTHHQASSAAATVVAAAEEVCSTPVTDQTFSYSSMLNESSSQQPNSHLLIVQAEPAESEAHQQAHLPPIKLKMKMAYQQQLEQQQVEQQQQQVVVEQTNKQIEIKSLDSEMNEMKIQQNTTTETVDCQCKTCGNTFSVVDPYNFKCNNCHVKYTSLPTHLIADPLQCIGCCAVFPHKPALKAHQMVPDKERPFRCCKCGYGFR